MCNISVPFYLLTMEATFNTSQGYRQVNITYMKIIINRNETFDFAHPVEKLRDIKVYCCDHYGSMLMDMQGQGCCAAL